MDTVCALLATADRYIQYKCTKFFIQKVGMEYVISHFNILSYYLGNIHIVGLGVIWIITISKYNYIIPAGTNVGLAPGSVHA